MDPVWPGWWVRVRLRVEGGVWDLGGIRVRRKVECPDELRPQTGALLARRTVEKVIERNLKKYNHQSYLRYVLGKRRIYGGLLKTYYIQSIGKLIFTFERFTIKLCSF